MGIGTKKKLHDAIVQLDEHEQALTNDKQLGGFWQVMAGLAVLAWTFYEIYAWVKSL